MRRNDRLEGGFEVLARGGTGGMGEVYKVLDTTTGQAAALKIMRGSATAVEERFTREARALEKGGLPVFRTSLTRAQLTIADAGMSSDLGAVLAKVGGSLAVNGGFFEVDTMPEGLAVSEGRELSARSLVLGGGVVAIAAGLASLFAVEDDSPPPGLDFAVQCRPRLVVSDAQHVKKDDGREAERTALCLREGGSVVEIVLARGERRGGGPTLSAWSALLAARGCEGALNLDGEPSTGAAWVEGGAIRSAPPREGTRHAIVVTLL